MKDILNLILTRRTIRRFKQERIDREILKKMIDAARLAPSAANLQPCEYIVVDEPELLEDVFSTLRWAGYIAPKGNPLPGEKPVAYIIVLINENKAKGATQDAAAAIENMLLLAWSWGIGSCWLGSIDRERLAKILNLPSHCRIDSVLALGYPLEAPVVEEMTDSIKYWKDEKGTLHVPKRKLETILHWQRYNKWQSTGLSTSIS
jgi:nitroreductase